jgi:hypothetical protein
MFSGMRKTMVQWTLMLDIDINKKFYRWGPENRHKPEEHISLPTIEISTLFQRLHPCFPTTEPLV